MIRRPFYVAGLEVSPAPASPTGSDLVVVRAPEGGARLDREDLEQLREVLDEALA